VTQLRLDYYATVAYNCEEIEVYLCTCVLPVPAIPTFAEAIPLAKGEP
jgi:hypothetical protein